MHEHTTWPLRHGRLLAQSRYLGYGVVMPYWGIYLPVKLVGGRAYYIGPTDDNTEWARIFYNEQAAWDFIAQEIERQP